MRVGVNGQPFSPAGVELVRQAERLRVDSVWVAEFWAADALTPLAYVAAKTSTIRLATRIVQLGARTPAMLAMSAQGLQAFPAAASWSASAPRAHRFAEQAAVVVANVVAYWTALDLSRNLSAAMEHRGVIEQAKGS